MHKTEEIAKANIKATIEKGPGLRYSTGHFVGGWREKDGKEEVLLSGLGGMGVGTMWVSVEEEHKKDPGWDRAKDGWKFSFFYGKWIKKLDDGTILRLMD